MKSSEQINEIAKALASAQNCMQHAVKDAKNPHFRSDYAQLKNVISAVRDPLNKNGICFTQICVPSDKEEYCVETVLIHSSGQWISSEVRIPVSKNNAHGVGSAITYAKRYGLVAICGLPEDEDDDGNYAVKTKQGVRKNVNAKTQGTLSRLKGSTVQSNAKANQEKASTYENDASVDQSGAQSDQISRENDQAYVTSPTFATDDQVAQLKKLWEQLGDAPESVQQKIEAISKRLSEMQVLDFSELSEEHAQKLIERLIDLTWECE